MRQERHPEPPKGKAAPPTPPIRCRSGIGWCGSGWRVRVNIRGHAIACIPDDAACRRVNRASHGVYLLRRHPEAASFRAAWEAALAIGIQRIEDVAMDRALNGVEVPVYAYGKIIGTRRVYNDRLLMFMLRNRAPKRFAADGAKGMNAVDQMMLTRLKKEWRAEWENERALTDNQDEDEILDSINAKLDAMQTREAAAKNLLLEDQSAPEDD